MNCFAGMEKYSHEFLTNCNQDRFSSTRLEKEGAISIKV
jgi:hypothetical protein